MTNVLDLGQVLLVDHMASDGKVTGAARVSTGKGPEYVSKGEDADRKLIGYLMKNGHGSPFEHAVFQWFVKAPIFVVREWQRHRIASYNEQSGRYSEFKPEFYIPDHVRSQDPNNKQSSIKVDSKLFVNDYFIRNLRFAAEDAYDQYEAFINNGVSREMARMVLPVNMYTSFWFTINSRSLMNFLALRNAPEAQWEIQQYAKVLEEDFASLMPLTYEAFIENGRVSP